MFYKFLNNRIGDRISKLHPQVMKYLSDDLEKSYNEIVAERLMVFRNYTLLYKHFETDQKRLYMINKNYLNFLKAMIYLYQTSPASTQAGILMAPAEIYDVINYVKKSFKEATASLGIK